MSFGTKLDQQPVECFPGEEIIVTLEFLPGDETFEREATIYLEEAGGMRPVTLRVKSAPQEPAS